MLKIATFNMEGLGGERATDQPVKSRLQVLRPQLLRLNADILCLQEINGEKLEGGMGRRDVGALRALISGTPYETFHMETTKSESRNSVFDIHNLVILSRFPFVACKQVCHHLVDPPHVRLAEAAGGEDLAVRWDRPFLMASFEVNNRRILHVLNLHLRAPLAAYLPGQKSGPFEWKSIEGWAQGYYLAALKRSGQALEARLLVESLFQVEDDPLIAVCGDLNAEDNEVPLRLLVAADADTGNGRLAHHALVPLERSVDEERRYTVRHHGSAQMLDHILVSRALLGSFDHLDIHNETLADELVAYGKVKSSPESYHAPMVASFDLG